MPDLNKSVEVFRTLSTLSAELKNPLDHDQALLSSFKDMILGPNDSAELNRKLDCIVQCCQGIGQLKLAKIGTYDPLMEECIDLHTRKLLKNSTDEKGLKTIHTDIEKSFQSATSDNLKSYLGYITKLHREEKSFLKADPNIKADFLQQALQKIPVNLRGQILTSDEESCKKARTIENAERILITTEAFKKKYQQLISTSPDNTSKAELNSPNSPKRTLN